MYFRSSYKFILKISIFGFACVLSACARLDYNPVVFEEGKINPSSGIDLTKPVSKDQILIRKGDTLFGIARNYGIPIRKLIETNKLTPPYLIYPGKTLSIPKNRFHIARDGETAYRVSQIYNVNMGMLVRINKIKPPYHLKKGQKLLLPDRVRGIKNVRGKVGRTTNLKLQRVLGRTRSPKSFGNPPNFRHKNSKKKSIPLNPPPRRSHQKFLWPVKGKIIVGFGPRKGGFHNDGINISARAGTPVRAAENGVVAYVGNQLPGYGNLILIKHADGWMSAYAHGSSVLVERGRFVKRGQIIARVGRTGNVNRPQLHFELRRGDRAVNPTRHLVRFANLKWLRKLAFLIDLRGPG